MAYPKDFAGSNHVFNPAPGDEENVAPLVVCYGPHGIISRWRLTPEELAVVIESGGDIWLQMPIRQSPPPVLISGFPLMETRDANGNLLKYDADAKDVVAAPTE